MKKFLVVIGTAILLIIGLFGYNKYTNKYVRLDNVNLKENKKGLAVMIEQADGTYAESDTYPTGNYMLDEKLSGCIDKNGKEVPNAIKYSNGTVSFKTNSSSYCYVYFSKLTLVKYLLNEDTRPSSLWTSTLDGDGYRFVGGNSDTTYCSYNDGDYTVELENATDSCPTVYLNYFTNPVTGLTTVNYELSCVLQSCTSVDGDKVLVEPDNYICFGVEDKDACVGNTDLYMYRIIGIFEDSNGDQYVKLIKKEALNTAYQYSANSNVNWSSSPLYSNLNGSYFLSNTTYSYMQNAVWADKIKDWTWSAVNTLTYSNSGPSYASVLSGEVYYHEMNHPNKSSAVGEWITPSGKIGLVYVSDYLLSSGESALSYNGSNSSLKNGWMYLTNNDSSSLSTTGTSAPSKHEWTISRYGKSSSYYYGWVIDSNGKVTNLITTASYSARPVFYLNSSEEYLSGTGTASDPFMLDGRAKYTAIINTNNTSYGEVNLTSSIVYEGESATATLIPAANYKYSSNDCGGTVSGNTLTISNVTSNIDCTVTFVEKTKYTVTATSANTSYGTVSPVSQTVYEGGSAEITLTPVATYQYSSDDCGGTVTGNILTIPNVTSDKTCTVTFEKETYQVEILKCAADGSDCWGSSTGEWTYTKSYGETFSVACVGSFVSCWCTSGTGTCNNGKITVTGNGRCELWCEGL